MNHTVRIERHLVRDILASALGGALVGSIIQRSWIGGGLSVVLGTALWFTERADIREEEE